MKFFDAKSVGTFNANDQNTNVSSTWKPIFMQNKNRDDKIRTCDPRDPNTVRYQAALHPDI